MIRRKQNRWFRYRNHALLLAVTLLSACAVTPISPNRTPSVLDPQGPAAAHLANLWWVMLAFGTFAYVLVMILLFAALLRRRRATSATPPEGNGKGGGDVGRRWVILGGILLPLVILAIVFGYNIYTLAAVTYPPDQHTLKIDVTGRRWWWEVKYTDKGFNTANEIHIPVGVPVQFTLTSADVIHSFWVPQLHGKMDVIPSRINTLTLQADNPGIYRGECAEFCGLQHAHMGLMVVAESSADFDKWVKAQQQPAAQPPDDKAKHGQEVFKVAKCAVCHTIRGLDDTGVDASEVDLGPDLTHVYSHLTIGAGTLYRNLGNIAGWIIDSQHVKPGNLMPNMYLESQDLQDLLAYLQTLH
ncbi:MAG: cytochrome c oxidase subunit II [Anaerolineae bacterium]|nr:cytochrome c oxidase subunit II [Anaerolineae bacterium]